MLHLNQVKKNFKNQVCLLRIDLNIEPEADAFRVKAVIPTIKFLLKNKARILLLSHRGRPTKMESRFTLRPFAGITGRLLQKDISFVEQFDFKKLKSRLATAPAGSVFLLENLRFLPGEEKNDVQLAKKLGGLGNFYVNDAFAVSHRADASIAAITKFLPAYAGFRLEEEIKNLDRILKNHRRPLILILGGAKIGDKIGLIKSFLKKYDLILLGGGPANTFFAAHGLPVGQSLYEPEFIKTAKKFLHSGKIKLPVDLVISKKQILDIGPKTVNLYSRHIKMANTIIWNGPLGLFENPKFAYGSEAIAKAIANSKAFSVIGGGETAELIIKLRLENKIGFLSTGGGAMLEYLSGRKLPGIEALK